LIVNGHRVTKTLRSVPSALAANTTSKHQVCKTLAAAAATAFRVRHADEGDSMASRSAIIGGSGTAAGHHLLDIEGYSHTKETPTGTFMRSNSFRAVDHSSSILYYPNGQDSDSSEYISVFLRLDDDHVTVPVKARATFSLLAGPGRETCAVAHTEHRCARLLGQ
jgi:hypothetical protein